MGYKVQNSKCLEIKNHETAAIKLILQKRSVSQLQPKTSDIKDEVKEVEETKPCPDTYKCFKCGLIGDHWIMNCPLAKKKKESKNKPDDAAPKKKKKKKKTGGCPPKKKKKKKKKKS